MFAKNMEYSEEWINHPGLKQIDKNKLEFLHILFFESKNLSQEELLPFFMSVMDISKEKKINFSQNEINCIIDVLKEYADPKEINKMEHFLQLKKTFSH